VLLAVSDNGPQMTSTDTRAFMAMCAIAQHFGRPGTPTDQTWIESLFSHVKADWPHLDRIPDPEVLRAELAVVRNDYNTVRLHAGIGYVTPPTSTTAAAHASEPPANADSDTPAGPASHTINYRKPRPTAGAPPMWTDSLPDLWL
jgi:transposase InsO family protein